MHTRVNYAVGKTVTSLHAVLATKSNREILLALVLTLIGFGAIEFGIDHGATNAYVPIVTGCAKATIFFFATVGFITFISTMFAFAYYTTLGRETPRITGWGRGWRIVFSFAITGLVTAAAFNLFYQGLREIQFVALEYVSSLDDDN
jgi:hypothetical protein